MALKIRLTKGYLGQKSISFMGPSFWNKLSYDLKILNTATSFTHNYKKLNLKKFKKFKTSVITFIAIIFTKTFIIIVAIITVIIF